MPMALAGITTQNIQWVSPSKGIHLAEVHAIQQALIQLCVCAGTLGQQVFKTVGALDRPRVRLTVTREPFLSQMVRVQTAI